MRVGFTAAQAVKGSWPIESDAAGVHPSQIPEAMEEARKLGVNIEYTKSGKAIFHSLQEQRKYCRRIGLNQRNSFLD